MTSLGIHRPERFDKWDVEGVDVNHEGNFAQGCALPLSDVVCVGNADLLFAEVWNEHYVAKLAMLCKSRLVWRGSETPAASEHIREAWEAERSRFPLWYQNEGIGTKDRLYRQLGKYFRIDGRFDVDGKTAVLRCQRILPPLKPVFTGCGSVIRDGDSWMKRGYSERQVLEFVTVLQWMGRGDLVTALLTDETGAACGVQMRHVEMGADPSTAMRLFWKLYHSFAPIGYLPHDVTANNVHAGLPIDVCCLVPVELRFASDQWPEAQCRSMVFHQGILAQHVP